LRVALSVALMLGAPAAAKNVAPTCPAGALAAVDDANYTRCLLTTGELAGGYRGDDACAGHYKELRRDLTTKLKLPDTRPVPFTAGRVAKYDEGRRSLGESIKCEQTDRGIDTLHKNMQNCLIGSVHETALDDDQASACIAEAGRAGPTSTATSTSTDTSTDTSTKTSTDTSTKTFIDPTKSGPAIKHSLRDDEAGGPIEPESPEPQPSQQPQLPPGYQDGKPMRPLHYDQFKK
jgi:hypothetical protein